MKEGDLIKGTELVVGVEVQRMVSGKYPGENMIVYEDGVCYKNPLYSDDEFLVTKTKAY